MSCWSPPDPIDGSGFETVYTGHGFRARLLFDCHRDARKLEITLQDGSEFPYGLLEYLKPFGVPQVVSPGQLVLIDRVGYFRLYLIPGRLQALLRKTAPLSVIGELLTQVERGLKAEPCEACAPGCPQQAISYPSGSFTIDDRTCTRCLDCLSHHVQAQYTPPPTPRQEADEA